MLHLSGVEALADTRLCLLMTSLAHHESLLRWGLAWLRATSWPAHEAALLLSPQQRVDGGRTCGGPLSLCLPSEAAHASVATLVARHQAIIAEHRMAGLHRYVEAWASHGEPSLWSTTALHAAPRRCTKLIGHVEVLLVSGAKLSREEGLVDEFVSNLVRHSIVAERAIWAWDCRARVVLLLLHLL